MVVDSGVRATYRSTPSKLLGNAEGTNADVELVPDPRFRCPIDL